MGKKLLGKTWLRTDDGVGWPKNPSSPNAEELAEPCRQPGTKSQVLPGPIVGKWGSVKNPSQSPGSPCVQIKLALLGFEPVVLGRSFLEEVLATPEYQTFKGDPQAPSLSCLSCKTGTVPLPRLKAGPHPSRWAMAQVRNERLVRAV